MGLTPILESPTDTIIYRSKLNPKINRNFEVFTPTDFLAAITQHIPDKGAQMVRYYGWYSNKMRGQRHRAQNGGGASAPLRPPSTPPPPRPTALQKVARSHPPSLAHRPDALPHLPAAHAVGRGH